METLYPELRGAVLACSVPPSGNSGLVWRYLFSKPIAAFKVTSLAAKAFQTDLSLCRETFFSSTMEDHLVLCYQELMKESSRVPLFDLRKLKASFPVPSVPSSSIEVLVLGVPRMTSLWIWKDSEKQARFTVSLRSVCKGLPMMLDCSWEKGAAVILKWLDALIR